MGEPIHEQILSGDWTAARFATTHWDLADQIQDVFLNLDPRAITRDVLDHTEGSKPKLAMVLLLDDWFGQIADPYADEDDA